MEEKMSSQTQSNAPPACSTSAFFFPAVAIVIATATAAMADNKVDCQKGVAMIKAELRKKHPEPVLTALRKTLSDAETEVIEEDWSECMDHIKSARAAL